MQQKIVELNKIESDCKQIPIYTTREMIKMFQLTWEVTNLLGSGRTVCWHRPNEESSSGQRLSNDHRHSWKTEEMMWASKNIKQHLITASSRENPLLSFKKKLSIFSCQTL